VDVEASGLDADRDTLLAIGAIGVRDGVIDLADSFEVVLRQAVACEGQAIIVHGIGSAEQCAGMDPAAALEAFLAFIGEDPLVAFHAPFDERMLARATQAHLGVRFRRRWLDLAEVAPLAFPDRIKARAGLDAWLGALAIPITQRHRAIADCLATAQLFLAILDRTRSMRVATADALLALGRDARWLQPSSRR
jgi:DNA polymerase III subunit epsilon